MIRGILIFFILWAIFMGIFSNWKTLPPTSVRKLGRIIALATISALATTGILALIVHFF